MTTFPCNNWLANVYAGTYTNCTVGQYLNVSLFAIDDDDTGSCTDCPSGTYMDEGEHTQTSCKTYDVSLCNPGFLLVADRTVSSDRVCAPCDQGSTSGSGTEAQFYQSDFSYTGLECEKVAPCDSGERTLVPPTQSRDRDCTPCLPGTFQDSNEFEGDSCVVCPPGSWSGEGASTCTGHKTCGTNEFASVEGTSATDTVCTTCQAGQYKLESAFYFDTFKSQGEGTTCGGSASFTDYTGETWPIEQAAADLSTCGVECAAKNSNADSNGSVCTAYSVDVEEGTCTYYGHSPIVREARDKSICYVRDITPISCQPCERGSFNANINHVNTTCSTVNNCTLGQFAVTDPWPNKNRECASCIEGATFQDQENHESGQCKDCQNCAKFGLDVLFPCTVTSNSVCAPQAAKSIGNGDTEGSAAMWGTSFFICIIIIVLYFIYLKVKNTKKKQRANKTVLELKAHTEDELHAAMIVQESSIEFTPDYLDGKLVGGAPIYVNTENSDDFFWRFQVSPLPPSSRFRPLCTSPAHRFSLSCS